MRMILRGSKSSMPETGQTLAHMPQVWQVSWEKAQDLNRVLAKSFPSIILGFSLVIFASLLIFSNTNNLVL